ncbi:MAG: hypothetical protein AMJ72_02685 [Acidithiobacillales bacterium SM1_46]|nr:MAG: hypothetical protein AMJ72_02685 [Acidithiobacillales bacterium SM1_46]
MAEINFNVSDYDVAPRSSFDPLPKGDYQAIVTDSQLKTTKAGDGEYIELTMQIVDGEYSGRRHWERLNVVNKSEKTQNIARSHLNSLAQACGVPNLKDTSELHDIPFMLSMDLDRREEGKNKVMGYGSLKAAPKPAPRPTAAVGSTKKAWER